MTGDIQAEDLILLIRKLNLDLTSQLESVLRYKGMSGFQVYFMVYFLRHHPEGTYLTELCHETGVSKSALSGLIKKLRNAGYLSFQEDPQDIRRKELFPTLKLLEEGKEFLRKADRDGECFLWGAETRGAKAALGDPEASCGRRGGNDQRRQEVILQ